MLTICVEILLAKKAIEVRDTKQAAATNNDS